MIRKLNNEEMLKVQGGGAVAKLVAGIIGSAIVFLIGVVDGLMNPKRCN